jgi:chemotaxis protein methyltransferase CheR
VQRFRDIIASRLGLQFDDGKLGFLADVLERRLDAGAHCAEYLARLEHGPSGRELAGLAPDLTVPETYFFRNVDQFHAFSDAVVPDRMRAQGPTRRLRVLSAGCASGEEPYTLAIAIQELALDPSWQVSIRAVDLNRAMLDRAALCHFSPWSLRETPPEIQARWFRPSGREFRLDRSIAARVAFEQRNLAEDDPALWQPGAYDVVFFRNVLMYFTPAAAPAVVERIARSLAPGGYLFLGHAETLRGMSHEFHLCHTHGTFYYQRKTADELAASPDGPAAPRPLAARVAARPVALVTDSWVEAIARASERIWVLSDPQPREALAAAAAPVAPAPHPRAAIWDLRSPLELLRQERFGEALGLVQVLPPESAGDPDVRLLEAVLLAHSGELARAAEACRALLSMDELNAGAHYILALCCEGAGDRGRAIEHDQAASYIDPGFAMPRLHLGLLARRAGDHADARRAFATALDLFQREDPSRLLFFGGGFSRDALVALCRDALVACGDRT